MNKTDLIAKISIKYVLPTCIWKYFWRISRYFAFFGEFRGISRKYLNFADPRPREISEALFTGNRVKKADKKTTLFHDGICYDCDIARCFWKNASWDTIRSSSVS